MSSYEFLQAWREKAEQWQAKVPAPAPLPTRIEMEGALMSGDPLVTLVTPSFPPDLFTVVLADLAGLYAEHAPADEAGEGARSVENALKAAADADREALVEAILDGSGEALDRWGEAHGVSGEFLRTLAGLAIQPFMARFAESLREEAPISMWRRNYCPVCGERPDVCRIDPDNNRHLHCPRCDTQWEHHRLTCVCCDTDNVKQVSLLTVQSMEPWRVEVCGVCGGYTKTLDQRHGGVLAMPKVDLFLEDARTLSLDLIAEQEGYRRGGRPQ